MNVSSVDLSMATARPDLEEFMELILSSTEREFLLEVLGEHHRQLREISRTKHHAFKHVLKNKEKLLKSIISKLELPQPADVMLRSA